MLRAYPRIHLEVSSGRETWNNQAVLGRVLKPNALAFALCSILCSVSSPAYAALLDAHTTLTESFESDQFGHSVAINGNTAIVGGSRYDPLDDSFNPDSFGVVYLYDVNTGKQIGELTPNDYRPNTRFGSAVALNGNVAIVSGSSNEPESVGAAYLFNITTGEQLFQLTPLDAIKDPSDTTLTPTRFATSVAISGNIAIVGARMPLIKDFAYLFDVTTGEQIAKLVPNKTQSSPETTQRVAIDGKVAVLGSPDTSSTFGEPTSHISYSGAAYLYDTESFTQIIKVTADTPTQFDRFGTSVAMSDNKVLVGASGEDGRGAAYLFNATTGERIAKLLADDLEEGDQFGSSVSISGNLAMVGAYGNSDFGYGSGATYLFDVSTGEQITKFTSPNPIEHEQFGKIVSISGNNAIIGTNLQMVGLGSRLESVYLFQSSLTVPEPSSLAMLIIFVYCLATQSRKHLHG